MSYMMKSVWMPADRINIDATGEAAGVEYDIIGTQAQNGLEMGGQPLSRGVLVGFRVVLMANATGLADTITIRVYRGSETSQDDTDLGEELYQADYVFGAAAETQGDQLQIEYPFFEQPFITIESAAVADANVSITPLVKSIA